MKGPKLDSVFGTTRIAMHACAAGLLGPIAAMLTSCCMVVLFVLACRHSRHDLPGPVREGL